MTQPSATGSLSSTPFCELLVYALVQSLSGCLVLECPDRSKHAVRLSSGVPVKARVAHPDTLLGQVLLDLGLADAETLRGALAANPNELLGQRLYERGALDPEGLSRALSEQLLRQLGWLSAAAPATVFAYFDGADFLEDWGGDELRIDPLAAIWRAVEGGAPQPRIQRALAGLADKTLRLHPDSRVARFGFPSRARSLLDVLKVKPQGLPSLEATGLLDRETLHQLLYALLVTRHLDTGAAPLGVVPSAPRAVEPPSRRKPVVAPARVSRQMPRAAAAPASRAEPAPPASPAPAPPAPPSRAEREELQTGRFLTREEIEAKLQVFERQSLYEVLELARDASAAEIALAFAGLARRWHPDRLNPEHGDLREAMTRIFARMTEASRVLGNPATRKSHDESLVAPDAEQSEQAQVAQVLRAAEAFQKAEILMKKRDLDGAERLARTAFESDADQPEYAALYAFIRARRPGVSEADLNDCLGLLKKAVAKQSNNVKIHYYLACVLKLSGQQNAAMREFRLVAEQDPSNVEVARELRLHEMRKHSTQQMAANAGLFSKLFKR